MKIGYLMLGCILVLLIIVQSCTNDKIEAPVGDCQNISPTWNNGVADIIELTCAYSGCHISGTSAPGNYLTYGGILSTLNNGSFKNRVFDIKDNPTLGMPPDDALGQTDLTQDQLDLLSCWMTNGFPEN